MSSSELTPVMKASKVRWEYKGNSKRNGNAFAVELGEFNLFAGELVALLGASGSGKSTLSSLLGGIWPLQDGSVEWLFDNSWHAAPKAGASLDRSFRRHFGMLYQDYRGSLNDRRTVADIVRDPLDIFRSDLLPDAAEGEVKARLAQVGIPADKWTLSPSKLSGGQRQRVALARALILKPRFLFLDEPTSSLDPSMQARILRLLMEARREWAPSCVLVTHDLALVRHVADRVIVLDHGEVVDQGSVDEVLRNPGPVTKHLLEASR